MLFLWGEGGGRRLMIDDVIIIGNGSVRLLYEPMVDNRRWGEVI